jgi:uncharacterized protein (TIGR03437 family)
LPGLLALCLCFAFSAAGQSPPPLSVQKIPAGQRPMGVAFTGEGFIIIANSGENSLSVWRAVEYSTGVRIGLEKVISGIPGPFGVSPCSEPGGRSLAVVTFPSANSISLVNAYVEYHGGVVAALVATVQVGSQPYSAACFGSNVFVSNYGDSTVSVIDKTSFKVTRTIANVPGSRGLRGVVVAASESNPPPNPMLWVAGTDANVVTIVNTVTGAIVASIPVRAPTALGYSGSAVLVPNALDSTVLWMDARTFAVSYTIANVPTPQDFASFTPDYPWLATTGPGNSLVAFDRLRATTTYVSGIPGAAGIVAVYYPLSPSTKPFILVTSPDTNTVFLIQSPPGGTPSQFSVVGASFGVAQAAPGGLASAFGTTGLVQSFLAQSLPLPKTLGGVSLRIGGTLAFDATNNRWNYSPDGAADAPLLYVGPTQVNFQVPPGLTGSWFPAQLTRPDGSTLLSTVTISPAAPGIFTTAQSGAGQAAVLNQDNTLNSGLNPAKRGSVIQIFATGAGETTPALAAGEAAPVSGNPLVLTKIQPTVTIGGKNAKVQFSGMAPGFVGLWQINAEVPQDVTPSIAVPLVVTAAGAQSNTVTIAVQ